MLEPKHQLAKDIKTCRGISGLYAGMLAENEAQAFERLCQQGLARRVYDGAGGIMGLAKIEIDRDL